MNKFMNKMTAGGVLVLVVVVVALNLIASRLYTRLDMTDDNIYSLSEGTENILGKLDSNL